MKIDILQRETLVSKRYKLEEIRFSKTGRDGHAHEQKREVYHRGNAVAVLLIDNTKQQILLTRQFRLPVYITEGEEYLVEACAGVIDDGEATETTAHREVLEETGYEITNLQQIGSAYTSPACITEKIYLFTAEIDIDNKAAQGGGLAEEGEEIEPHIISFTEVKDLLRSQTIHDMKTIALLQHFCLHIL